MSSEVVHLTKTLVTPVTLERFFPGVDTLVFVQSFEVTETLVTQWTGERLGSRVDTLMSLQIRLLIKTLATRFTAEESFFGVEVALVTFQTTHRIKTSVTQLAEELPFFGVDTLVSVQSIQATEGLVALRTIEGFRFGVDSLVSL